MAETPLVSIIIPCYNQEALISETITSILGSHFTNIEIIIVDDGSTDSSRKVLEEWRNKDNRIQVYSQPNAGPSVARNHAIRKSSGKYILPVDGDDLISEDYISRAVAVLEEKPEVKVVYCLAEKFGAENKPWKLKPFSRPTLAQGNMIFVSAMFRKTDWEKVGGFSEEMTWGFEDWEFWISMLKEGGEVVQLPIVGFFYRIQKKSRRKSVDRKGRQLTYSFINHKHKDFIYQHLNGPIRKSKTWSRPINTIYRFLGIPV
ncbi:glycosyltransferase family 2 protein [Lunatibacter salilacus]|uniref:glycosyltransferase family 2 protein n=1 Tax=Lunatibacter salilacus TaxID=2483804 RepID=UPI00131DE65D|nr:glycosyltransferase family A protein [Lunatibacter salilacus]